VAIEDAHFLWRPLAFTFTVCDKSNRKGFDKMDKRDDVNPLPLVFNHFENTRGIGTKTGIVRSL
jgi:hypothetical protein